MRHLNVPRGNQSAVLSEVGNHQDRITPEEYQQIVCRRLTAYANGYALIRVQTGSKKPYGQWGGGHGPAILQICDLLTANTGLLCAGLAIFDVDLPEPEDIARAQQIHNFLTARLPPGFLERRRQNSERFAFILRTRKTRQHGGLTWPRKQKVEGALARLEVLGDGQYCVIDGWHETGAPLVFVGGRSPWTVPYDALPEISSSEVADILNELARSGLLGERVATTVHGTRGGLPESRRFLELLLLDDRDPDDREDVAEAVAQLLDEAGQGNRHDTLMAAIARLCLLRWRDDDILEVLAIPDHWNASARELENDLNAEKILAWVREQERLSASRRRQ